MPSVKDLKKKKSLKSHSHKQVVPDSKTGHVRRPGVESHSHLEPHLEGKTEDIIEVRYAEEKQSEVMSHGHDVEETEELVGAEPVNNEVETIYEPSVQEEKPHKESKQEKNIHDVEAAEVSDVETAEESELAEADTESAKEAEAKEEGLKTKTQKGKEFKFHFVGSDLIRKTFPKSLEVVEKVADEWKKDGDFDEIPIEQPLVHFVLGEGLRRAKRIEKGIEKKIEEKLPEVLMRAQTGIEKVQTGIKTAKEISKKIIK